mgnify:CR=1 FL=1
MISKNRNCVASVADFCKRNVQKIALAVTGGGAAVVATAVDSRADDPITTMFNAASVSSLQTNVQTLMLAGVAVTLTFIAYRWVKKGLNRM